MEVAKDLIKRNGNIKTYGHRNKILLYNGIVRIPLCRDEFGGYHVKRLLENVDYVLKMYGKRCRYIELRAERFTPKDKLSYVILEVIIYKLINDYKKKVFIAADKVVPHINTYGILESIFFREIEYDGSYGEKFCNNFTRRSRVTRNSFRRLVKAEKGSDISELMTDSKSFLKGFLIDKNDIEGISRIVTELADNACEHAQSDCFVDIDVSEDHYKDEEMDQGYYAVNICVLNFSDILLGDQLKKKMQDANVVTNDRYLDIVTAYNNHKKQFDEYYTDEHFFALSSFQDKISGRAYQINTGGRGLAEIVGELEKRVSEYECYVMFGNKVIFFHSDCLDVDSKGYIAFNTQHDFVEKRPEKKVISYSPTNLCGTGYNLSLIYKKES